MWQRFLSTLRDPDHLQTWFYYVEIGLLFLFGAFLFVFRYKGPESGFKSREADTLSGADQKSRRRLDPLKDRLAHARIEPKAPPKLLPGINIEGRPHEILGISAQATPKEIQQAYRKLMKIYHPDRTGSQDSPQWKEAQKIAEAVNRAKDEMLKQRG